MPVTFDQKTITDLGALGAIIVGFLWLIIKEMPAQRALFEASISKLQGMFSENQKEERTSREKSHESLARAIDKNTSATETLNANIHQVCKSAGCKGSP